MATSGVKPMVVKPRGLIRFQKQRAAGHALVIIGLAARRMSATVFVAAVVHLAVLIRRGQSRLPFRRASSKLCAALDLSRGLRVDERNLLNVASDTTADAEPGNKCGLSKLVFAGDPVRVREGFELALRIMGIGASMPVEIGSDPSEQGE
jgi:hypothetical protein